MKKAIIISCILFLSVSLFAQESQPYASISFLPQAAFTKSLRLDFEYRYNNDNWIAIAPRFYFIENLDNNNSGLYSNYVNVVGYGGNIYHKWFNTLDNNNLTKLYLALGSGLHHFNTEYSGDGYHYETNEFGEYILTDGNYTTKTKIDQLNFELNIGFALQESRFLIDMFVGSGFKYSLFNEPRDKVSIDIREGFLNFGYSGFYPIAGIKFGVIFNK